MTTRMRPTTRREPRTHLRPTGRRWPWLLLGAPGVAARALAFLVAGLMLALAWGGYFVLALGSLPVLGLALAIRGAAASRGVGGYFRRRMTRGERVGHVLLAVTVTGLVGIGLLAFLWR